ncbi:glutaredoxin family protein [Rhodococcus sp. NPDC060176]|uniref:glutaredoxin family protein n=1 Tax=Rhodococcus sp. NPDC060176 TaxID=3347062 RepID=UPI00365FC8FA
MNVTVYTQPGCQPCKAIIRKLIKNETSHTVIDVSQNAEAAAKLEAWGYKSAPVVEVNGEHYHGYSPDKLNGLKVAPAEREVHRSAGVEDRTDTEDKG